MPHVLSGEVVGLDGTKVWPMLAEPADRCVLWVVAGDMAGAQLDLAGVEALQRLLGEVAAVMRGRGEDSAHRGASPAFPAADAPGAHL
jgi:hypothetical protein